MDGVVLFGDMRGVLMLCSLGEEGLSLHRYPSLLRQVRPPSDTSSHSMSFSTLKVFLFILCSGFLKASRSCMSGSAFCVSYAFLTPGLKEKPHSL
ncbi:hypothetical protein NHX12_011943 [Muraenolepis orangiensis]|uniref:Uncharacterized protein n=1 Tax=Muraenolepis orangiensis TaxID=630683 RepID=A0A9Q0DIZ0_9TELE|nr:hypothetical protein NHX12_011941 [Muraenolepis orangiensis]KAJ3588350.1 hypothetical protein NHX12_011943 [Muraenolepis orangiensis]